MMPCNTLINWRPLGDSNPCRRRERADQGLINHCVAESVGLNLSFWTGRKGGGTPETALTNQPKWEADMAAADDTRLIDVSTPRNPLAPKRHEIWPTGWRWKNGAWRYRVPKGQRQYWDDKVEFTLGRDKQVAFVMWATRIRSMYASMFRSERAQGKPWVFIEVSSPDGPSVFSKIDADLFDFLSQWSWRLNEQGYVVRRDGKKHVVMHRVVAETPEGSLTDHINRDPLDNRRCNLRHATYQQNAANRTITKGGYKGVNKQSLASTYSVKIKKNGRAKYIGSFDSEEVAALVYDACALIEFGEFASLNFPLEDEHAE